MQCGDHELVFHVPNWVNRYRADTFFTKEPQTIVWIDTFEKESVMWDVGANVGLYSIYAAKFRDVKVFAFETSVFNLEWLAKNIYANQLHESIYIVPIPLSDSNAVSQFMIENPIWGGANSAFGIDIDSAGNPFHSTFKYNMLGVTADQFAEMFQLKKPTYLKIDVDGIEHLILRGASNILKQVQSVLVEVNGDFNEQKQQVENYLSEAGLILEEIHYFEDVGNYCNQLWKRK